MLGGGIWLAITSRSGDVDRDAELEAESESASASDPEPEAAPEIVRVVPPTTAVRTVLQAVGCDESTPPTLGGLGDAAHLVQSELWDRALAMFRSRSSSRELRDGLREVFTREGDVDRGLASIVDAPDRIEAGFDHASAAAFTAALRAMGDDRFDDAERWMAWIDAHDTESHLAPLARAVRARYAGDAYAERDALRESLAREPEQPGVALTLALREMRIGKAADALAALNAYRETAAEDNAWVEATLPRFERAARLEASMTEIDSDGIIVLFASALDVHDAWRVHGTVLHALDEAARLFGRERRPRLVVVIYASLSDYDAVTCGPRWSGARYDGSLRVPGSVIGDPQEEDTLRHEALHAQLAWLAPNAPLWLHEGLAQRFETERSRSMRRTFRTMIEGRTYVPFPSIEGSFMVIEDPDSARFAYHQSYAMVEAILQQQPDAMSRAVRHLSTGGDPASLLDAMSERALTGEQLLDWVAQQ